jgi:hypothetical protein
MDQMTKTVVEPVPAACEADVVHWGAHDSRTLKRYFLDFVLPVLTLAAMSALTIVLLVLIVSSVADMELYSQSREAAPDPWSAACSSAAPLWDGQASPDDSPTGMLDAGQPATGQPSNSPVDAPWARWVPE